MQLTVGGHTFSSCLTAKCSLRYSVKLNDFNDYEKTPINTAAGEKTRAQAWTVVHHRDSSTDELNSDL